MRWAAIEACQRTRPGSKPAANQIRITTARAATSARSPLPFRLLTLVFYGLRDGEIRALAAGAA